jgi:prepilin-type N-terminal cleavage/methylation domain-containing protein
MRGGFTLLETLIGLVIAALIALVTLDSLSAVAGHAERLNELGRSQAARTLALTPVQRALENSVPDYHEAASVFRGEARLASGLTMAPASGLSGLPARYELRVEQRGGQPLLVYLEQDSRLLEIPLAGDPVFAYEDRSGKLHDVWPPAAGFRAEDPLYYRPIPSRIMVRSSDMLLLAASTARTTPLIIRSQDAESVL